MGGGKNKIREKEELKTKKKKRRKRREEKRTKMGGGRYIFGQVKYRGGFTFG